MQMRSKSYNTSLRMMTKTIIQWLSREEVTNIKLKAMRKEEIVAQLYEMKGVLADLGAKVDGQNSSRKPTSSMAVVAIFFIVIWVIFKVL
uniref:Uncharacterized protein n=1 Tax=Nelumbo nucifera TaxID=4432 RepID=A0A822YZX4_NELNU|nr:TPA_asm: hypothetical protein HUJ06_007642 [Nelumbo nucifera]